MFKNNSVITIPMPKGFKFDSDMTKKLNNFKLASLGLTKRKKDE